MPNVKRMIYILAMILLFPNSSQSMPQSDSQIEAENVIKIYHLATTQGDTATIRSLLGGDLLKKRSTLLDNPTYPQHLISVYGGSTIEIMKNIIGNNGSITIEAKILLKTGEVQQRSYLLKENTDPRSQFRYSIVSDTSANLD